MSKQNQDINRTLFEVALAIRLLPPGEIIAKYGEHTFIKTIYLYWPHLVRRHLERGHYEQDGSPCKNCKDDFIGQFLAGNVDFHN